MASLCESVGIVLFIFGAAVDLSPPLAILLMNGVFIVALLVPFETFRLSYTGRGETTELEIASSVDATQGDDDGGFRDTETRAVDAAERSWRSLWRRILRLVGLVSQVSVHVCVCVCMCVCMYACVCACMGVCARARVCVRMRVRVCMECMCACACPCVHVLNDMFAGEWARYRCACHGV